MLIFFIRTPCKSSKVSVQTIEIYNLTFPDYDVCYFWHLSFWVISIFLPIKKPTSRALSLPSKTPGYRNLSLGSSYKLDRWTNKKQTYKQRNKPVLINTIRNESLDNFLTIRKQWSKFTILIYKI